jgi:hypothetical protein
LKKYEDKSVYIDIYSESLKSLNIDDVNKNFTFEFNNYEYNIEFPDKSVDLTKLKERCYEHFLIYSFPNICKNIEDLGKIVDKIPKEPETIGKPEDENTIFKSNKTGLSSASDSETLRKYGKYKGWREKAIQNIQFFSEEKVQEMKKKIIENAKKIMKDKSINEKVINQKIVEIKYLLEKYFNKNLQPEEVSKRNKI